MVSKTEYLLLKQSVSSKNGAVWSKNGVFGLKTECILFQKQSVWIKTKRLISQNRVYSSKTQCLDQKQSVLDQNRVFGFQKQSI